MRILSVLLFTLFSVINLQGQMHEPVKWEMNAKHAVDDEFWLVYEASIEDGWNVYSMYMEEGGPIPTSVYYNDEAQFEALGKAKEKGDKKEGKDPLFKELDKVIKFTSKKSYIIRQKIKAIDYSKPLTGELEYMTCNDKTCLPPTFVEFEFDLKAIKGGSSAEPSDAGAVASGIQIGGLDLDGEGADAGMLDPISWDMKIVEDGNQFKIIYTGMMEKGWNLYSQYTAEGGPLPTEIVFDDAEGLNFIGKAEEAGHMKEGPDPLFDGLNVIKYLDDEPMVITQTVKVSDKSKKYKGYLTYQTCDATQCLPPTDVEFEMDFAGLTTGTAGAESTGSTEAIGNISPPTDGKVLDQRIASLYNTKSKPIANCGEAEVTSSDNMWSIFAGGFAGGLLAILLPCIFPMIPITVSFFTKDTKRKGWVNGLIYGLSIIIIFVSIGLAVTAFLGPEALQKLSTSWIANTLFFLIFVAFAISFFGYFEIALPASWSTKSDQMADKGGLLGTFFMAFTLALVSFSCTGPIIGTALVQVAANGSYVGPFMVMFGFSSALALPFGLFAAFPSWLNSLPKSGGWMTTVKVVLGFLELALALKFLSVADMTSNWGFLRYELFLGLWVLIFIGLLLYLLGIIRFPHDAPLKVKNIKPGRWIFIAGVVGLIFYLSAGFRINKDTGTYRTPGLTSGITPPATYNYFLPSPEEGNSSLNEGDDKFRLDPMIKAKYPSYTKCAQNINCFKEYSEGLAYAKEVNKPVFIDFTGHGCVNCRKTEEYIWVENKIRTKLNDDYVLVSLYTDDRKKINEIMYGIAIDNGETIYPKLRNVGTKWSNFQIRNFDQNSQPLYVIMNTDQEVVAHPRGYREGIDSYDEFLDCGLKATGK